MIQTNSRIAPPPTARHRRFIINLTLPMGGKPVVRSCELSGRNFRNRTSFSSGASLSDAFSRPLAEAISECMDRLTGRTEVLSLPNFLLEAPGMTLQGVHLMATRLVSGTTNIILRFQSFLGGINNVMAPQIGFEQSIQEERQAIAIQIMEDIAAPLLNICTSATLGLKETNDRLGSFGRRLAAHTSEIYFRIDLLRRFIEQDAGQDVCQPALGHDPSAGSIVNKGHRDAGPQISLPMRAQEPPMNSGKQLDA